MCACELRTQIAILNFTLLRIIFCTTWIALKHKLTKESHKNHTNTSQINHLIDGWNKPFFSFSYCPKEIPNVNISVLGWKK